MYIPMLAYIFFRPLKYTSLFYGRSGLSQRTDQISLHLISTLHVLCIPNGRPLRLQTLRQFTTRMHNRQTTTYAKQAL